MHFFDPLGDIIRSIRVDAEALRSSQGFTAQLQQNALVLYFLSVHSRFLS
jgi:hypothetical protein